MQVEAVLFDLFDTLLLLEGDEAYYEPSLKRMHAFLAKNGVIVAFDEFKSAYFEVRDKFYAESRKTLEEPHFNVRVSQTLQKLGYDFDASDPIVVAATTAFADEFMQYVRADSEASNVLQRLKRKYKLGLVSNFGIPECGRKLLDRFGLSRFFDVIIISGEVNQRKPSPKIFRKALHDLGADASKSVFVGDMLDLDIMGPKNVGIKAILIERKPVKENAKVKPDKVVKNLTELADAIESF